MHDEDCQLPSLDWLTDTVKQKSSKFYFPDPVITNFSLYTKHSKIYHCQKKTPEDVDFANEAIKPPYSYAELITLAMRHHGQSKVLLTDIYDYVKKNFAWYRRTDITWQNSIRHNLSLNKQFIRLPRKKGEKGKGSYWMLDYNAIDSSNGSKIKKNGITAQSKMKIFDNRCKPTLNPAVLLYLKKQNERRKQQNVNNLCSTNPSTYPLQITEENDNEIFDPENGENLSAIDGNVSFHSSSASPPTISSFTEFETDQELLETADIENYRRKQTIIEHDKSPVWWRNDENSTSSNSLDFGQPSLPKFTDLFANSNFDCPLSPNANANTEEHLWPDDLQVTNEYLFFDLST